MSETVKIGLGIAGVAVAAITVPVWGGALLWIAAWSIDWVSHWHWPQH